MRIGLCSSIYSCCIGPQCYGCSILFNRTTARADVAGSDCLIPCVTHKNLFIPYWGNFVSGVTSTSIITTIKLRITMCQPRLICIKLRMTPIALNTHHCVMMHSLIYRIMMHNRGLDNPVMDMLRLALASTVGTGVSTITGAAISTSLELRYALAPA